MSHAPGPWNNEDGCIVADTGEFIASVTGGDGTQFLEDDQNAECAANARLIAAAPDLLAALQFYADRDNWQVFPDQENYASEDAGELAREAIRKALGESHGS